MDTQSPKNGIWAFWKDSCKVYGAIGPFLSAIYWFYKWLGEPPPMIKDLSWAWGMVPLLILVIVAYVRRWLAFKELAQQLEPEINLMFEPGSFCEHISENHFDRYRTFCVILKNKSLSVKLTNCHVDLMSFESDETTCISLPLRTIHNREQFDLSSGQQELVKVVGLREPKILPRNGKINESESFGTLTPSPINGPAFSQYGVNFDKNKILIPEKSQFFYGTNVMERMVPQGKYIVKIKAFSDQTPSKELDLIVDVQDGKLTMEEATEQGILTK